MPTSKNGRTNPTDSKKGSISQKRLSKSGVKKVGNNLPKKKDKLIALDTNVLMNDPYAMFHFKDSDNHIFVPKKVLEELNRRKNPPKNASEENLVHASNARKAASMLLYLAESVTMSQIKNGIPLLRPGEKIPRGKSIKNFKAKLFFEMPKEGEVEGFLDSTDSDQGIILTCLKKRKEGTKLPTEERYDFLLVSLDKIMRIFALLVGLRVETYLNDTPSEESLRSKGVHYYSLELLEKQKTEDGEVPRPIPQQNGTREYVFKSKDFESVVMYEFLIFGPPAEPLTFKQLEPELQRQYIVLEKINPQTVRVRELKDYQYQEKVFYVHAKNAEQNCLCNAILVYKVPLTIVEGEAGTGKTFITLACAYQQIKDGVHKRVQVSRDAVESGEKIGFLPGSVEAKIKNFLPGTLGSRKSLLSLLSKDITEKRRVLAKEVKKEAENTAENSESTAKVLSKAAQKRIRKEKLKNKKNSEQVKGGGFESEEITKLVELRKHLEGEGTSFESVSLLRGGNIDDIALIDEAQHTRTKSGKMLPSRVQEGGQMVLTGNVEQDDIGIPFRDSGIAKMIDATRGTDLMCLITLRAVERGRLAARIAAHYK